MAAGDPARHAALAAATALLVAAARPRRLAPAGGQPRQLHLRDGDDGFKTGVALHLASTQLPKLFGFEGSHGDFWERMGHFLSHLGETNPASLALGARRARSS